MIRTKWKYTIATVGSIVVYIYSLSYANHVRNCVFGTAEQEALDLSILYQDMLEGVLYAYNGQRLDKTDLPQVMAGVTYAWAHFQRCVSQRGLEFCRSIGSDELPRLPQPEKGGPKTDDPSLYQYRPSLPVSQPEFQLEYAPPAPGAHEWNYIQITLLEPTNVKYQFTFNLQKCVLEHSNSAIKMSRIGKLQKP